MWARIGEIILGIWLILSFFIFDDRHPSSFIAAGLIFLFALLSYSKHLSKMHLCHIIPIGLLFYVSYSYPTPWLPMGLQNYIVTALLLLIFTIVPSHASDSPESWR